jgi:uncharacterized protein
MTGSPEKAHKIRIASRLMALLCMLCAGILEETIDAQYRAEVERGQHEDGLKANGGALAVTGLFRLKEGSNTVGDDTASDMLLPDGSPSRFGDLQLNAGKVVFVSAVASVGLNGKTNESAEIRPVGSDVLSGGDLQLFVIERGERLALRNNFTHLNWYPIQEDWEISARSIPAASPAKIVFATIIGEQESNSSGSAEFERDGKSYRLQAAAQRRRLFFVIRDLTSGKQTYTASCFLDADGPKDGDVPLDFNKAENPWCACTPYATHLLPPPKKRLPLADTSCELKYEGRMPRRWMLTDPGQSIRKDFLRAMAGIALPPFVWLADSPPRPNGKLSLGEATEIGGAS